MKEAGRYGLIVKPVRSANEAGMKKIERVQGMFGVKTYLLFRLIYFRISRRVLS